MAPGRVSGPAEVHGECPNEFPFAEGKGKRS